MDKADELKEESNKKSRVSSRIYYKKSDEEKRTVVFKIYTNQEERKQLERNAKRVGRDVSTFFRELGLEKRMIASKDTQRWSILGKLGSQFVKFKNEAKGQEVDHLEMIGLLNEILVEIKLLREELLK